MSEPTVENLSERERACLEHVRQAQELGVSFAEYCRSFGLNVNGWYSVRHGLVRKGLIAGRPKTEETAKAEEPEKSAGFVPVRVVAAAAASPAVAFRLQHASGWTIECASLPAVSWIKALVQSLGGRTPARHAA